LEIEFDGLADGSRFRGRRLEGDLKSGRFQRADDGLAERDELESLLPESGEVLLQRHDVGGVAEHGQVIGMQVQGLEVLGDGLDQDAVDYWNIRVYDCDGWDEIAFFSIDDYTSLPASFILPANQISADRYYNIEVWVDGPKAEGKNYSITIHASDGSDILSLPANLITIESEAFSGTGEHTVIISQGTKTIETGAFSACPNLEAVYLPDSLTSAGSGAFPDSVTIYASSGSYAANYAKANGLSYVER